MAAVAISPIVAPELERADFLALEREAHGRSRDASRVAEAWAGVSLSMRTVTLRDATAGAGDMAARVLGRLLDCARVQGLADDVVAAGASAVIDAGRAGARRVVAYGSPAQVQELRVAAPSLDVDTLYVVGLTDAASRDALNGLADLTLGGLVSGAPWVIVRNARGRALLDALEAEIWLDGISAAAYRATAELAAANWHGRRPQVVP